MIQRIFSWLKHGFFRNLIKNSATILTGSMMGSLIGLASFALTLRIMGGTTYGMFVVVQTYIGVFDILFNFQSWESVIRFGSQAIAKRDQTLLKGYIKLGLIFDFSSAFFGALTAFLLVGFIGHYFNWDNFQLTIARIYTLSIIFNITGTPQGVLRLLGKFKHLAWHRVISSTLKLLLILFAYFLNFNTYGLAIILIIAEILEYSLMIGFFIYVTRKEKIKNILQAPIRDGKEFVKFGFWTNIVSSTALPMTHLNKFFIAKFLSYEAVSAYKLINQFALIIRKLLRAVYSSLYPDLAKKIAAGEWRESIKLGMKLGVLVIVIGAPLYLVFSISAPFWLGPIFGKDFSKYLFLLIFYMGYKYIFASFVSVDSLFLSFGYVKSKFAISLVAMIVYIVVVLSVAPRVGLIGFVLAEIVQEICLISTKVYLMYKRHLKRPDK